MLRDEYEVAEKDKRSLGEEGQELQPSLRFETTRLKHVKRKLGDVVQEVHDEQSQLDDLKLYLERTPGCDVGG